MTKDEFIGFADEVIAKKNEKKAISAEIKVAEENFADKHNIDKNLLRKL